MLVALLGGKPTMVLYDAVVPGTKPGSRVKLDWGVLGTDDERGQ